MKKRVHVWLSWVLMGVVVLLPGVALAAENPPGPAGGAPSLEERVKQLEAAVGQKEEGGKWLDRIKIGGLVEVEAGYGEVDDDTGEGEESSDVDLATVELSVDADIASHVTGHVLFKWEEDELSVDEGFVTLGGGGALPAYLIAGRQYVPFGHFDTHFVTDPNTLVLGETNEGAGVAGYRFGGGMFHLAVGAFNGEAQEAGDDDAIG